MGRDRMKPHWQKQHEGSVSDVRFWLEEIYAYKLLLRKHPDPDDALGDIFREVIKGLKRALAVSVRGYEKIYGDRPDVVLMRREVEA